MADSDLPAGVDRLATLTRLFLVDEAPIMPTHKPRVFVPPSPRAMAPKPGRQLLQWICEEADEQHQLGRRMAQVRVTRRDLQHLRYLQQWIAGKERERVP